MPALRAAPTIALALVLAVLAGCQRDQQPPAAEAPPAATLPAHTFGPEISTEDLSHHVRILASDEFEGRAPGTRGEQLTVDYISSQFRRLGLQPGNGDSYTQSVPMMRTTADPATVLSIRDAAGIRTLAFGSDMVVGTSSGEAEVTLEDSELVFLGFGVNAPEADWNDYSIDVRGKTVVVLVNDPGFHSGDASLFQGKRMTYYGRWTYKFEEAARQGAAAALIIHEDEAAGYGWSVVENGWVGPQFDLPASEDPAPRLPIKGWLTADAASDLFQRAGLDLAALREAAGKRGFAPVPLKASLSVKLKSEISSGQSDNVLALLPGASRPDEVIVYMGHWDHLGRNPALEGDQIYNGAVDNATGIAGILEIAEQFVTQNPPPARSILFLAVTLEESGLLGSKYYVNHPVIPLANTVAAINLDAMSVIGRTRDFTVIGYGNSELEDVLRPIAERQSRILRPESAPEKGFYYRSDHFNFARAGVPALYAKGGVDHFEKGEAYGLEAQARHNRERYHQPSDEYDPSWDLTGLVEDLNTLYAVGRILAAGEQWPNWYEGNEFKATRDAAMAAKAATTP